ncbi:MAG: 3-hydroxyacyl-CoA dehydrogenase NAD-binding domain-containing protein [Pseudomonadota bacterium]
MAEYLSLEVDEDGVAIITINCADQPMNVLGPQLIADISSALDKVQHDDAITGAIFTSAKKDFMAGADLKWLCETLDKNMDAKEAFAFAMPLNEGYRRIETLGKPFVAAINGTALGGGLELALTCHYRVAIDNDKTAIGLPEVQVGLLPGGGGTQRLPRLIGIEKSLPLLLRGTHISPAKAHKLGIIDELVSEDELITAAKRWLKEVGDPEQPWDKKGYKVPGGAGAMHPGAAQQFMGGTAMVAENAKHNYPAPIAILSSVYEGTILPIDRGLTIESQYFATLMANPVAKNMIRTLFVNKGAADKLIRRPDNVASSKVSKLGILGAGMMGAGIAYASARAGMDVVLLDRTADDAAKGKAYSQTLFDKAIERGKSTPEKARQVLDRIKPTDSYAELANCDLVIEAVFEDRSIKADVTKATEAVIGEDAIFASNTSTLPITGLAEASSRPSTFIGIHFFSPVEKMPLVEIIVGEKTSDEAIARSLDYVAQLRKTPIVVSDSRGFYTSRVFSTFTDEGTTMLDDGIIPAVIENAAKFSGMPVGPLAVLDEVTLELAYKVTKQTEQDLGADYEPASGWPALEKMVELNRKGKRFGAGFYEYPEDGKKHLWSGLKEQFPTTDDQPDFELVKKRLLHRQALEAARCLEEGVISAPEDGDIGSVFGIGFPPYTGGPFGYIDTIGIQQFVADCEQLANDHGKRFQPSEWLKKRASKGEKFYA